MKKTVALITAAAMFICMSIPALGYSNKGEITEEEGLIIEGLFNGMTYEEELPQYDGLGGWFGMHFADFVWVDDVLYSYYIRGENGKSCIGLATSTDAIHFEDKGLVINADSSFDLLMASFAGVWYEDGVFYVTYEALPESDDGANIALATSTDGIHFEKKGIILYHDRSLGWQNYNIGTPDLYKVGDMWYLTFHGFGNQKKDCQIGVAYGTDLFNLTMVDHPVIETSNDPNDPDCGTCGRRDVIYYNGWYYMTYEISTDGGKINRNLGDDLGVEGKYYYDFSGSSWGHKFARSRDMINWEKIPYLLHDTYTGDYAYDGPSWLVKDGEVFIYYRGLGVRTCVIQLKSNAVRKTDSTTGISLVTHKDADFSAVRQQDGELFENASDIRSIGAFRVYKTETTLGGEDYTAPVSDNCRVEIPRFWVKNKAAIVAADEQGNLTEIESTLSEQDGKSYLTFNGGVNKEFMLVYKKPAKAGDVNFDGKLSAVDALITLQAAVGSRTLSIYQPEVADLDGDGKLSASDALTILLSVVGKTA